MRIVIRIGAEEAGRILREFVANEIMKSGGEPPLASTAPMAVRTTDGDVAAPGSAVAGGEPPLASTAPMARAEDQ